MKKISLLGLIGFVLTGCGDDKVTKEYLVGKWKCDLTSYRIKFQNEKFVDYVKDGLNVSLTEEYKIENEKLYVFDEENNNWTESDVIDEYSGKLKLHEQEDVNHSFTHTIKKESQNKFTKTEEQIATHKNNELNQDNKKNYKINAVATCNRIE